MSEYVKGQRVRFTTGNLEDARCMVVPTAPLASPGEMSDAVMLVHAASAGYDVGVQS